tara:strand:+ start:614 stop:1201 length:588 start_codon:yes stop_codon:yes gene_type:complete
MLELVQKTREIIHKLLFLLVYKHSFKSFGKKSTICFPFKIDGAKYITIGNKVHIHSNSWFLALKNQIKQPKIQIDDGVYIGRFSHIVSVSSIKIGKNVLISDKVYISDNLHEYRDINIPIKNQKILEKNNVSIGNNTWLGENTCVIGASIGNHCVIGANSVVLSDIADYSIAVGSPARVIKKYDFKTKNWEKVSE